MECPPIYIQYLFIYTFLFSSYDYGVTFFKQFKLVLNALDNRVARNHVNRMCLAANVPLVETGTAGYAGQVKYEGFFSKTYPYCPIIYTFYHVYEIVFKADLTIIKSNI